MSYIKDKKLKTVTGFLSVKEYTLLATALKTKKISMAKLCSQLLKDYYDNGNWWE